MDGVHAFRCLPARHKARACECVRVFFFAFSALTGWPMIKAPVSAGVFVIVFVPLILSSATRRASWDHTGRGTHSGLCFAFSFCAPPPSSGAIPYFREQGSAVLFPRQLWCRSRFLHSRLGRSHGLFSDKLRKPLTDLVHRQARGLNQGHAAGEQPLPLFVGDGVEYCTYGTAVAP